MVGFSSSYPSQKTAEPRTNRGAISWDTTPDVQKNLVVPQKLHRLDRAVQGAPILGLTSRMGGPRTVPNVVYYLLRTKRLRDYITTTASATASDTSISFSSNDISLLVAGYHVINLRTREIMPVTAATGTAATVTRSFGTVSAAAVNSGDVFMILGYVGLEGDAKFFGLTKFPEVVFNYCGEIQHSYAITQIAHAGKMMAGAETPRQKERIDAIERVRMDLEKQTLFSQRQKGIDSVTGKTKYAPNGLDAFCTENEKDFDGDVSVAKLEEWAESLFRHGGPTRMVMASPKFMRKVNLVLSGVLRQSKEVLMKFGLRLTRYEAGAGTLVFFRHPLFQDDPSTAATALNGHAYAVPMDDFRHTTINSSLTGWFKWFMNVQTPGNRELQDQLICNWGTMMTHPEHYGRALNVGS